MVDAFTVMAVSSLAGETLQASRVLFPEETTTGTPEATNDATFWFKMEEKLAPRLILTTAKPGFAATSARIQSRAANTRLVDVVPEHPKTRTGTIVAFLAIPE
jgi:hypothetical protein